MKKILKNKKGFSLIELMIVIVIIWLMLMLSYAPYNLYQSKAKLRVATREVAQSIYEAKNMAVSWVSSKKDKTNINSEKQNKIVWIYLSKDDSKKNNIYYYINDFKDYQTKSWGFKDENNDEQFEKSEVATFLSESENFKIKNMQQNIWLQKFSNSDKTLDFDEILIVFAASSWEVKIFWKNWWSWNEVSSDSIKINMSFWNSTSDILKKEITYYTKTNIIDYK